MRELQFFLSEALEYFFRGRGTTLASVVALTAVLFLLALLLLATHNVAVLAERVQERKGMTVFLDEGSTEVRARELQNLFASFGEVQEVRFVHREQALQDLEMDLGGFPVASTLGENPLPHTLVIALTPAAAGRPGEVQRMAAEIRAYEDVDDVVYGDEWVESLDRNLRTLFTANLTVGILGSMAVFLVLVTTLRLVFLSRRETVRILKVVGATDRFIRTPFLLLGGLQCALSSVIALTFLAVVRAVAVTFIPGVRFLPGGWQFLFLVGAFVLGVVASFVSIEPALRGLESRRDDVVR